MAARPQRKLRLQVERLDGWSHKELRLLDRTPPIGRLTVTPPSGGAFFVVIAAISLCFSLPPFASICTRLSVFCWTLVGPVLDWYCPLYGERQTNYL